MDDADATLGLDANIPIKAKKKISRIDNDRLFNKVLGLPYIVQNYHRVNKKIQANDKKSTSLKYQREHENLGLVLEFYHLWCHGLFPKATFADCQGLVRRFGDRLQRIKLWRRELLTIEVTKLMVARGIVNADEVNLQPLAGLGPSITSEEAEVPEDEYVAPLDFSFMGGLSLFVSAEDNHPPVSRDREVEEEIPSDVERQAMNQQEEVPSDVERDILVAQAEEEIPSDVEREALAATTPTDQPGSPDPFDDDDDFIASLNSGK